MVLDLLGSTLEALFLRCERSFLLEAVLPVAIQLIACIQDIHKKSIVHGDLKPGNIFMGTGKDAKKVSIIDFGLAQEFCDRRTKVHVTRSTGNKVMGAFRYMSINTHLGISQSRRDDMISLGYIFAYLLYGELSWQDLGGDTAEEQNHRIMAKKEATSVEALFAGCSREFVHYHKHALSLGFEQEPDYAYLRKIFLDLSVRAQLSKQ